jgi:hypothetical protein
MLNFSKFFVMVLSNSSAFRPRQPAAVEMGRFLWVDSFGTGATSFREPGNETKLEILAPFIFSKANMYMYNNNNNRIELKN